VISKLFVKIGRTVEKLFKGVIFHKNSPVALVKRTLRIFEVLMFFHYRAESVGILFVEIGSLVEKLFWGIFFTKKSPVAP
jgi:hypothetical protein